MLKTILIALLPLLIFFSNGSDRSFSKSGQETNQDSGTIEKMIVAEGSVAMDLNLGRLNGSRGRESRPSSIEFEIERTSFFKTIVFNGEFRGMLPSTMDLAPRTEAMLPTRLQASYQDLVLESLPFGEHYELAIRDSKTGFTFFNVEGQEYDYNPETRTLKILLGRVLLSNEFAAEIERPSDAGALIGQISVTGTMRSIEITHVTAGDVTGEVLPAGTGAPETGTVPGPDVVVGDLAGLAQFGASSGTRVGLAIGTDSCNFGTVDLNWFANPSNDHPVIPQNLYRMSGGSGNNERFEQIGQSHMKHAFTALTQNLCQLGCNGVGGTRLGSGCSDPYGAGLNSGPNLGSRAWVNPFTGFYPRNDSATPNNLHPTSGADAHNHNGTSHRILTEVTDLYTSQNAGATYFAEGQYVTPHEYAWCQLNPGQCNMNNNVSYRQYSVSGNSCPPGTSGCFSFAPVGSTQRTKPAINAWVGATIAEIRPDPAADGLAYVGYKVTNPAPGVWHYEYAVYNMNLDRAIQSLSIPTGAGVTLSAVGFRSPPQHPGYSADGTFANAGFSSTPWSPVENGTSITWSTETLAQNANANAIRWGTLYNFRFDSNRPPQTVNATIGFYKTGAPITVQVQGPAPAAAVNVSVGGRVTTQAGMGIGNAYVYLNDTMGIRRLALTNPFGYYRFDNVLTGGTYQMGVLSRFHNFPPPVDVVVTDNITNQNFVALP